MDDIEVTNEFGPGKEEEDDEDDSITLKSDEEDYKSAIYDDDGEDDESITSFSRGGNIYSKFKEEQNFFSQSSMDLKKFVYNKPKYKNALEDAVRRNNFPDFKRIFKEAIEEYNMEDKLDEGKWEDIVWENEGLRNFWYETVNNLNEALKEFNIVIDRENKEVYNSLIYRIKQTTTSGKREVNGYQFDNIKIIGRNKQRKFYFYKNDKVRRSFGIKFLDLLKDHFNFNAKLQFSSEVGESSQAKRIAVEYLNELRDQERSIVDSTSNFIEMRDRMEEIGDIEEQIDNIKKNNHVRIDKKVLNKTFLKTLDNIKSWARNNKTPLAFAISSLTVTIVSGIASMVPLIDKLKEGAKSIRKIGNAVQNAGKKISDFGKKLDSIMNEPIKALGGAIGLFGEALEDVSYVSSIVWIPLFFLFIIGLIIYFINKWREEY